MDKQKKESINKKAAVVLLVLAGLGFVSVAPALASHGDGRKVVVGSITYKVKHDGNGPHIKIGGNRYYLNGNDNNRTVIVAGRTYSASGHKRHHGDHRRDD